MSGTSSKTPRATLRLDPRVPSSIQAEVVIEAWSTIEHFVISNVSRGGLHVVMSTPPPVGSRLFVKALLPNQRKLEVKGVVRHVSSGSSPGVGIEVDATHVPTLQKLLSYARTQSPAPSSSPRAANRPSSTTPSDGFADVFGIDFGVCYSAVAIQHKGKMFTIPNDDGERAVPTVIHYPPREAPIVGMPARKKLAVDGPRVVSAIKRILGRFYSDPLISGFVKGNSFATSPGPNDTIVINIDGQPMAVTQVCADIFRDLLAFSQKRIKKKVTRAALSHPVAFDEVEKDALQLAAKMAGIEVVGLIPEPVAVALGYGLGQGRKERIAVYDFGGGTFDFTVIDLDGDDFEVLTTGGDGWLGGQDLDGALADAIANSVWRKTKVELRNRAVEWQELLLECERAKCALSVSDKTEVEIPDLQIAGESKSMRLPLSRSGLERICRPYIDRSLEVCREAMASARIANPDITRVLASGGTSQIPFVRGAVETFFGRPLTDEVDPATAVVKGVGLWATRQR